jgi:hypothetical protein
MDNSALFFKLNLGEYFIRCLDLEYFDTTGYYPKFGIFLDDMVIFGLSHQYTEGHILRLLDRLEPLPMAYCYDFYGQYCVGKLKYVPLEDISQLFMRQAKLNDNYQPFAVLLEAGVANLPSHIIQGYTDLLRATAAK